jgi:hypothetical protein
MTKKQQNFKRALIKQVHTSPMYKGIFAHNRDLYEDMLKAKFGVTSSKDLSIDELIALVDYLNHTTDKIELPPATQNQIAYIKTQWLLKAESKDETSLLKFIKRVTKKEIKSLENLTKRDASKVIGALNNLKIRGVSDG